jgi:hypothetical protein
MATTISTLKFMVTADAGGLVQGVALTKREIREAGKIADEARGPWSAYSDRLERLKMLHAGGGLSVGEYKSAINGLRTEMLSAVPILGQFTGLLNPITAATTLATAGMAAFAGGVALVGAKVSERLGALDDLGDKAARLDANVSGLSRLTIAGKLADVEEETLTTALRKLQIELGKAASGNDAAIKKFDALGVSVDAAVGLDTVGQFEMVAAAINKLPTNAEKLAAISDVMGKSSTSVVTVIKDLKQLEAQADATGAVVSPGLADKAGEFDLATKRLTLAWDGLGNSITAIIVGPLTKAVDLANSMSKVPGNITAGLGFAGGALAGPGGFGTGMFAGTAINVTAKQVADDAKEATKDLAGAHREAAVAAAEQDAATTELTKAEVQAEAASQKYLDGLRERLQLVGANTEAVTRFNAAKAGLSFMETAEAVRIVRETEERNKEIASRKEWADELERGETALRAEAEAAAKSVEDPTAAAGKRVGRFAELRDFGLLDDAQLKALTRKEAAGLVRDLPAGVGFAEKGSAAARQAVIESKQGDRQVKALERMVKILEENAKKEPIVVVEMGE